MPEAADHVGIRLLPIDRKSYCVSAMPESLIPSGTTYKLETCGWSSAVLRVYHRKALGGPLKWTLCQVEITHFDGETEKLLLGEPHASAKVAVYDLTKPIRLAPQDGSFVGQVTIKLTVVRSASIQPDQATSWEVVYQYGPSPVAHSDMSERRHSLDSNAPKPSWLRLNYQSDTTPGDQSSSSAGSNTMTALSQSASPSAVGSEVTRESTADSSISLTSKVASSSSVSVQDLQELRQGNDCIQEEIEQLERQEERDELLEKRNMLQRRLQELKTRRARRNNSDATAGDSSTSSTKRQRINSTAASRSISNMSSLVEGGSDRSKTVGSQGSDA